MDAAWGPRKTPRVQSENAPTAATGSSKLVQLQRQNLSLVSTTSISASSSAPLSASIISSTSHTITSADFSNTSNSNIRVESGHGSKSGVLSVAGNSSGLAAISGSGSGSGLGPGGGGSLSGSASGSVGSTALGSTGIVSRHPLHFNWVFWFMHRAPGSKILNYEGAMKKIATFGSAEDFWAVYSHLKRPHELPTVSDYHLFKQGVRPVWEDETNIHGGKWIVRLKKGLASRYWEDLVIAVIGDQFEVGTEICGAVLSIRGSEDILSLWNQSAHEGRINLKIRDTMKRVLNLPADTIMEYKTHNDALKDNSSFRNTDVFR
ncbi:translation initiation factor eIF 4e-like domain-containing protein [Gamsiella multidivaricata]|uniref:translation initiation factor eIF 4e-like domain-containing protein n=1 Tax=Gamsiella multidivaricata TaxID=101098 RepID=UPI002220A9DF|nr:translation initiation factor eIF 4e-like domain-containing protein [Gamsiella multidivaricata]KAG0370550.1 Eukaryotic translation initiation factor 4E type 2 [Gamsiella multidivaricata]KAI7818310.1 translation initiation factor eIF 4e-like domain-containing protein [Gamsiella multidivaricata]